MYKDYGFRKVIAEVGNSVTLKMQLGRVAKNVGLNIELIESNINDSKVS